MTMLSRVRHLSIRPVPEADVTVSDWSGVPVVLRDRAHILLPALRYARGNWYRVGAYRTRADGKFMTIAAKRVAGGTVIYGTVKGDA